MTGTVHNDRPSLRWWPVLALSAVLVLYDWAGLPHPGRTEPSTAAAHPLPGFPHLHGGNPICGEWDCPPPNDGTGEGHDGGGGGGGDDGGGGGGGGSQPSGNCVGAHAEGCKQGVDQGYIDPDDDLDQRIGDPADIAEMGNTFANHPDNQDIDFDADDFTRVITNARDPLNRGHVADALCAAISTCSGTGDEAIEYLLDNDISFGQETADDGSPAFNPKNPVTIGQMGSFFRRLEETQQGGGGTPTPAPPTGGNNPYDHRGDPDAEPCATGLDLSGRDRSLFRSELSWAALVGVEPQQEPSGPWPPHPDVPGGTEYLVVSGSPVWPVIDPDASWSAATADGCLWEAVSVQTKLTQLLPWRTDHRSTIEDADATRPDAGFDTHLSRWDNLSAAQQAQAQHHHVNRDVSASCGFETALVSVDSYDQCRWELPVPGVWSWQAGACFEAITEGAVLYDCATLARGVEWFLEIIDYTSGITLHHDLAVAPGAEPRQPAPTG